MRRLCLWMAWAAWGTLATAAAADVAQLPLRDTAEGKLFGPERFAVRLDPQTGWAGDVLCDGRCLVAAAGTRQVFDIRQDDIWITGGGAAIEGLEVERISADSICSRIKVGDWQLEAYVQLFPDQRMLRRWFEITWQGAAATKIKGFWFQGGQLPLAEGGSYFCPGHYPPKRTAAHELVADRRGHQGRSPYPVLADRGDGWSAIWLTDESPDYADRGSAGVVEGEAAIRVTQSFNMLGHARPDVAQRVGDSWLWLQANDAEVALRRLPEWFRLVRQVPPADRPDWLQRVILYSFHPGGTIGSQCQDLGGFRAATELLTHIRQLGCNAIWLMPLEDKSIYWPRDYYRFQDGLGTPKDYRALTARAHALGMRVWQDCVPHGGSNEFPRAKEHPEWLAQNEDGSTLHYWCFDFNWPTWIDSMREVVSFYTREYGLDGFRIDACGGSKIPNWNPEIPYARASHAQAQGGLAMQRALRQAVKSIRPDGANLAEVGASIHGTVSDSTYDFSLCYEVLHDFRKVPAAVFVPRLRRWLHEQQCAEVPDLVRMRHLESHDSLRSGWWYGAGPQRALLALISWIHGIPMLYHEMEDGHFDVVRQIFHVRSHVPELNGGTADYLSVAAPQAVFACLRTGVLPGEETPAWHADYAWDKTSATPERASIVLVNLGSRRVDGAVSLPWQCLPTSLREARTARDLLSNETLAVGRDGPQCELAVSLPPFGYTVLRFESEALPELAPSELPQAASAGSPPAATSSTDLELQASAGSWRIDPQTGLASAWQNAGRTRTGTLDLALPPELADAAADAVCRTAEDGVAVTKRFGSRTLELHYSVTADGKLQVRAAWTGGVPNAAALVVDLPQASRWQAQAAEGRFASPFRVRHPQCDGVLGSIYRLPQGTAIAWDSRLHPFGLSRQSAWVGAVSAAGEQTAFGFDPEQLPAYVQLLDRAGDSHGLKVLMAWQTGEDGVSWGGEELRFEWAARAPDATQGDGSGDERVRLVGGGWEFENAHYRARVARTGALTGLWRRQAGGWQTVLHHGGAYTDKGFGGDIRYAQENDVEASVRLERRGSDIRFSVRGQMRGFQRFDKMARPVAFYSVYSWGDGPAFRYACAVKPEGAATTDDAFLSLLLRTGGVQRVVLADGDGEFLTGERGTGSGRFAQLAQCDDPQRLPTDIRLFDAHGLTLRLGAMSWFGAPPRNVFLHGDDLHCAWLDGKPDNLAIGQWCGVSCSLACEDTAMAADAPLPLLDEGRRELFHNGDFETSAATNAVLVSSGRRLLLGRGRQDAWSLPPGAAYVVEDGSRCVTIEGESQSYRLIRQPLPVPLLKPGSRWRLSARMKGLGVERGDIDWKTACLRWAVSVGGQTTYATTSLPWGDSPWQTCEVLLTMPESTDQVVIEAGLNGNTGRVWIDDVRIERAESPGR